MKTNDPRHDLTSAIVLPWAAVSTKVQDKYSIEDQLRMERDWCAKTGATMLEPLVVRGFSRDYWTLADVVAAAAHDPDMAAFAELQQHIRKRDFTIFLCFDADRFGRTESLILEVLGRVTRDCKALVLTLFDGIWMDEDNAPTIGLLKAHKAQSDVTKLKEYRVIGMDNRAKAGKSTSAEMPLFHRRVRNEKGEEVEVVVNESLRPLWTDLATLIVRGVSWNSMEKVLFDEFGHGRDGQPYRVSYFHDLVLSPAFWGHAALNYRQYQKRSTKGVAPWIWDETVAPPPTVTLYRNRLPAVYGGEWQALGESVKAELWRRFRLRGKATSGNTFRFHGLLVCAQCGYTMTLTIGNRPARKHYIRCATYYDHRYGSRNVTCDQRGYLLEEVVQDYFDKQLNAKLKGLPSELFALAQDSEAIARRQRDEQQRIDRLQESISVWADALPRAPKHGRDTLLRKMDAASAEIDQAQQAIETLTAELILSGDMLRQQEALLNLLKAKGGTDWFWAQSDTFINQHLSAALGHNQLVVRDREIRGTIPTQNQTLLIRRGWSRRKK